MPGGHVHACKVLHPSHTQGATLTTGCGHCNPIHVASMDTRVWCNRWGPAHLQRGHGRAVAGEQHGACVARRQQPCQVPVHIRAGAPLGPRLARQRGRQRQRCTPHGAPRRVHCHAARARGALAGAPRPKRPAGAGGCRAPGAQHGWRERGPGARGRYAGGRASVPLRDLAGGMARTLRPPWPLGRQQPTAGTPEWGAGPWAAARAHLRNTSASEPWRPRESACDTEERLHASASTRPPSCARPRCSAAGRLAPCERCAERLQAQPQEPHLEAGCQVVCQALERGEVERERGRQGQAKLAAQQAHHLPWPRSQAPPCMPLPHPRLRHACSDRTAGGGRDSAPLAGRASRARHP
jgi:hypothetical protein